MYSTLLLSQRSKFQCLFWTDGGWVLMHLKRENLDLCPDILMLQWTSLVLNTTDSKQTQIYTARVEYIFHSRVTAVSHLPSPAAAAAAATLALSPSVTQIRWWGEKEGGLQVAVCTAVDCPRGSHVFNKASSHVDTPSLCVTEVPPHCEAPGLPRYCQSPPSRKQYTAHMLCFCFPWFWFCSYCYA